MVHGEERPANLKAITGGDPLGNSFHAVVAAKEFANAQYMGDDKGWLVREKRENKAAYKKGVENGEFPSNCKFEDIEVPHPRVALSKDCKHCDLEKGTFSLDIYAWSGNKYELEKSICVATIFKELAHDLEDNL